MKKEVGRMKTQWGWERGSRAHGRTSTVQCPEVREEGIQRV